MTDKPPARRLAAAPHFRFGGTEARTSTSRSTGDPSYNNIPAQHAQETPSLSTLVDISTSESEAL
ncbi:hypothetical protein CH63R_12531 [Colletotrichum higginsianum IMI 349063]|uniref:Uncharacterized protein n=1 Tax=Colletotrichum higginsianum (strain IMI 349063) TaxID=759273 RepID=A0A1B7XUJ0_COLHI|nr:hypothetical protein CH63R_12531 [Colletotrichum higginsianum IMI 349063]OBR03404.1 hypothetical protein CH63R_12531 [Colletotrichum higginsianum IMI 349063]